MSALTARFRSRVEPPDRIRPQINAARVLGHRTPSHRLYIVRHISIPTHVARVYAKDDSRLVITNQRSLQIAHMDVDARRSCLWSCCVQLSVGASRSYTAADGARLDDKCTQLSAAFRSLWRGCPLIHIRETEA